MSNLRCYKTFKRTANSMSEFARARRIEVDRNLTIDEARRACDRFNDNRTPTQIRRGTKLEFIVQ